MEMMITFPGGARVDANFGQFNVMTDQPPQGGGMGTAPTPFAVFLASIGTCAGIYVLGFLKQRGLSTDGIQIRQRMQGNPVSGMIEKIDLEIETPPDFPEKYLDAMVRAAELCAVKKHFERPPQIHITAQAAETVGV